LEIAAVGTIREDVVEVVEEHDALALERSAPDATEDGDVLQKRDVDPRADEPARAVVAIGLGIELRPVASHEVMRRIVVVRALHAGGQLGVTGGRTEPVGPELEPGPRRKADEVVERKRRAQSGFAEERVAAIGAAATAEREVEAEIEWVDADELELHARGDVG